MTKESLGLTLSPLLLALCSVNALLFALSIPATAQQAVKVPRIGYLSAGFSSPKPARTEAFRQGLRDLGYVEGQNILIEYRYAEGKLGRLPGLAAELLRLNVDLIFAYSTPAARVVKEATTTIPVVTVSADPVRNGFVASLARPGGNITGLANLTPELAGKRLELLKEVVPKISRVAVIWNSNDPGSGLRMRETEGAARSSGVKIQSLEVRESNDLERAFSAMKIEQAGALVPLRGRTTNNLRERIIELAKRDRVPTVYDDSPLVEAGGLMSYGTEIAELDRRAASYVDKILKGAKPANLPIEQPTKFELWMNLKTAKQIGLTIPPNVLARADKVIR
jgi:putative tryptophan/tyrosine transport system substrate-binding protein